MSNLWVKINHINATENYACGAPVTEETDYAVGLIGPLFRALSREYGRCVSRIYQGGNVPVGWVFQKRAEYQDAHLLPKDERTYLAETWVMVLAGPDVRLTLERPINLRMRKAIPFGGEYVKQGSPTLRIEEVVE